MTRIIANAVGYQVVWFVAVLAAARGAAWPGVAAAALFVALQPAGPRGRAADAALMAAALVAGVLLDGALVLSGLVTYAGHDAGWPAPAWILAVWVAFAATLERSLGFLRDRPLACALIGAIGGPLAWLAASRLGAVALADPAWMALAALAAGWAVVLPALFALARRGVVLHAPAAGDVR